MENLRILIVDDEETIRSLIKNILKSENYVVKTTDTAESALAIIKEEYFDLIILDVNLPGDSWIDIMPDISHFAPLTPIIVITGYAIIDDAVKAMKYGAFDYIKKPFKSKELLITIEKALKWKNMIDENSDLKQEISNKYN
ncbi:response regulator, partial [candidate division WOR-3 bacterium]|nr:response regulator [candidate division WOR-3 bacterium]